MNNASHKGHEPSYKKSTQQANFNSNSQMNSQTSSHKRIKYVMLLCLGLCVLAVAIGIYSVKIEPYLIQVKSYALTGQVSEVPLKIVQLSDIEISPEYTVEELDKIVLKVNAMEPDIVVFTGDLFESYYLYGPAHEVVESLSKIRSKYGKFAIWGNNDYGGGGVRVYESIMTDSGFEVLKNSSCVIVLTDDKTIAIGGLDDAQMGEPDYSAVFSNSMVFSNTTNSHVVNGLFDVDYRILLAHEPTEGEASVSSKLANSFKQNQLPNVDLILSGHTHGGQVGIGFVRELMNIDEPYLSGLYTLDTANKTTLIVSNGLGTSRIHARFLAPPQIIEVNLKL